MRLYTSDTHYGHGNIIKYCQRPFDSIADMNDTMVIAHNAVVGPDDEVIHVGDFAFGSADYVQRTAQRLNGKFTLIRGNHDRKIGALKEIGWTVVNELTLHENGYRLYIRHKPDQQHWPQGSNFHLVGHVHTAWRRQGNMINVGVDQWGFVPRTLEELVSWV